MAPIAAETLSAWTAKHGRGGRGVLAVSFDQRNHGGRLVEALANEAWRQGNARHAVDMFSIYNGTAQDLSLLISYLPAYLFPTGQHRITQHLVLGVSLGGHAAWHAVLHDPRIEAAVVVVGCPDYARLMADRARKSKLASYLASSLFGRDFFGSADFPSALVEQVERWDPAGVLLGELDAMDGREWSREPGDDEKKRLLPLMREKLGGKRILCLSGGKDKLVPYECGKPFMTWLKQALRKDGGWFNDGGTVLEDITDPEAGHEYSTAMRAEAVRFICDVISGGQETTAVGGKDSKI